MKPLLVSMGEPAGVGPELCLALKGHAEPLVVLGDKALLRARAELLGVQVRLLDYDPHNTPTPEPDVLTVLSYPGLKPAMPGVLNAGNAGYVLNILDYAVNACLSGEFSALVTAPVHKAVINTAGFAFTGHTEFLAKACGVEKVVMLLVAQTMRMALVTTHLPLRDVPDAVTPGALGSVIRILNAALIHDFGIASPKIGVAGLNPHAGESGYLGREEIDMIAPTLAKLKAEGLGVEGPKPADTLFTRAGMAGYDALLAMYHDQGLSVLKYAGFGEAVNITLGLPIVRTSVDHGTALDLAGTGRASATSLIAAVNEAVHIAKQREAHYVKH